MDFEAQLPQAVLLKRVVDAMKDLCKDVNFDCNEKGMQVQSMDSSKVALVSMLLRQSAFTSYRCERPVSLGMNVDALSKILKLCGPNDSLKLRWQSGSDTLSFQYLANDEDRIAEFDMKLMQIETEHMEIPEQHHEVLVKMPSAEFHRICRDLKDFGETMRMNATKGGITFSVHSDLGAGNVLLKPRESERPEERVTLTVYQPVIATFSLRYLVHFSRGAPLCSSVQMGLGPDTPLWVKYDLEHADKGYMQFYLAPKIDE
mmetsp:Transcript_57336/g.145851  ORF Transcript_57336/g.145851 Transcript_57336/m.145851 type:complete len:260 (+) Transcript_57336:40-819(+)